MTRDQHNNAADPAPAPELAIRGKHETSADSVAEHAAEENAEAPQMLYAVANLFSNGILAYTPGQPITAEAAERNGWTDSVSSVQPPAPTPGTPTINEEA